MTRFDLTFRSTESKFRAIIVRVELGVYTPPTRYTITMAIGSAVRSVRYESSVGDISMDVEQTPSAPSIIKRQTVAIVQDDQEVDDAEYANGDEYGYDYPEETKAVKKTRNDDTPFNRALPVAELPDDFEGEALDGATFLALSK